MLLWRAVQEFKHVVEGYLAHGPQWSVIFNKNRQVFHRRANAGQLKDALRRLEVAAALPPGQSPICAAALDALRPALEQRRNRASQAD